MPDLNLQPEDRIRLRAWGIATEEDNILDAAKDWTEGRCTFKEATERALDDIGTRRSSRAFAAAARPTTIPASTYDALLHSYQHLDAEMRPLYRSLRELERSRDIWRFVACILISTGISIGFVKLLEWMAR